jgi:prepilin-type N-terminal cleavage/methylation domain-containing protein
MRTSTPGRPGRGGFTLVELAAVLFVLGLILWVAVPRMALLGEPGRDAVFRELASASEAAYDAALFEKRETRLILRPDAGTYEFRRTDAADNTSRPREFGSRLTVTGIRVEGEDRLLDIPTEIRYRAGGIVPAARIFLREAGEGEGSRPSLWTLRLEPYDGSLTVLEGTVVDDG